jgi:hypothetical protein
MAKTRPGVSSDTTQTKGFISRNSASTVDDQYDQDLAIDRESNTKLHLAAKAGDLIEVQRLCSKGFSVSVLNQDDYTPFHFAALGGSIKVMQWILDSHPEVIKQRTAYDYSALHLAAQNADIQMVILLLQHGTNSQDTDKSGHNYLDILKDNISKDKQAYLPTCDSTAEEAIECLGVILEIDSLII